MEGVEQTRISNWSSARRETPNWRRLREEPRQRTYKTSGWRTMLRRRDERARWSIRDDGLLAQSQGCSKGLMGRDGVKGLEDQGTARRSAMHSRAGVEEARGGAKELVCLCRWSGAEELQANGKGGGSHGVG